VIYNVLLYITQNKLLFGQVYRKVKCGLARFTER